MSRAGTDSQSRSHPTDTATATADREASELLAELSGLTYETPAEKVRTCTRRLREAYLQGAHAGLGVKDGLGDDAGVAVTVSDDGRFVSVVHTYKEVTPDRLLAVVEGTDCAVVGTDTSYQSTLETTENAVWIAPSEYASDVTDAELSEEFGDWATTDSLERYPEWTYAQQSAELKRGAAKTSVLLVAYHATGYPILADWITTEPLRTVLLGASLVCMAAFVVTLPFWIGFPGLGTYRAWAEKRSS